MDERNGSDTPLWKNWRFQLLWIGAGHSGLGQAAMMLALPILIIVSTGSPVLAGVAAAISLATGILLGVPAGILVDRMDRRRILLLAQAAQPLLWGSFAAIVYLDAVAIWNVILVSALSGGAAAFVVPAHASALQALVPKPQLAAAHAQGQARVYAIQLAGPPLGGVLFAISRAAPFAFHVVATAIAILCFAAVRVPRRPTDQAVPEPATSAQPTSLAQRAAGMKRDFVEGLRWLIGQRGLRAVLGVAFFLNPLVNAIGIPIIVLINDRGGGSVDIGVVMASVGVGGLLGALASARLSKLVPAGKLVLVVGFVIGFSYCLVPLPLGMHWPMVPLILACLIAPALNVAIMALVSAVVPSSMMGRMSSMLTVSFQGLAPFGPVIGGLLAATVGGGGALIVCGVSLLLITTIASTSSALRGLQGPADAGDDPVEPAPVEGASRPQPDHDPIPDLQQSGVTATAPASTRPASEVTPTERR